jgi:hypothetical protein
MNMRRIIAGCVGAAILVGGAQVGGFDVGWWTIDGGGAMGTGAGDFSLSGTIGQHDAGPPAGAMTGGSFALSGGFWVRAAAAPPCGCGDLDSDGDVDAVDFAGFSVCFGLIAPSVDCPAGQFFCADLNGSGGVNLVDFSLFSGAFGLAPAGSPPDCE